MKYIKFMVLCFGTGFFLNSCSKNLNLLPQDAISNAQYWYTANDLTLYVNQFYPLFPVNSGYFVSPYWTDVNSDDMVPGTYDQRLAGQDVITTGNANWNFTKIRNVNFGLGNYQRIQAPFSQLASGVGELLFFRAYLYFNLVKLYGDVPWLSNDLNIDSTKELYASRTSRNIVIDSVLSDLDSAISYLPLKSAASPNRLNKECALLFKSRVALYEGTWEKYHANTPFGVDGSSFQNYLQQAADASKALIDLGTVQLYIPSGLYNIYNYYLVMFGNDDLTSNPEVLLWKKEDAALGESHNIVNQLYEGGNRGISKSLVESFLCTDGLPISVSPLYQGDDSLSAVVANRDPRLSQAMWIPGDVVTIQNNVVTKYFTLPWTDQTGELRCTTGYQISKGRTMNLELAGGDMETASIIFRYSEALLNYAEAQAELGQLTQSDVDISINQLRRRVDMPDLKIASITADPDWLYPNLSPEINEVRRERNVELEGEGFRFDDLERWADMGRLVGHRLLGAKFKQSDFPNLTPGSNIFVNNDGYIDPDQTALPTGFQFNLGRDYLLPIPQLEINLNKNLVQNPGW